MQRILRGEIDMAENEIDRRKQAHTDRGRERAK
jgi:hypothetical protein